MGDFFNPDNAFSKVMTKIVDVVWLSILFVISSIPIFTIGASMCGLYYSVNKSVRHNRGYVSSEFWHGFKSNFKVATPIWLLSLLGYLIMAADLYLTNHMMEGSAYSVLTIVFIVIIVFLVSWNLYTFPYISRFENTRKESMSNAGRIAIAELPWTVLILILWGASVFVCYIFTPAIFFIPALFTYIENHILERRFLKYMSEEDIEAEKERNQESYN